MRVSTRVEYGLIALTDIVLYGENGSAVSAPDIAQRENISHKYLEQILLLLRQAGFIIAQKGIRGGYALAKPAELLNALTKSVDNVSRSIVGALKSIGEVFKSSTFVSISA